MRHRNLVVATIALALPLFAGGIRADDKHDDDDHRGDRQKVFRAVLLGANEVPPVQTTGNGRLRLEIDDETSTISFRLTYAALRGTVAVAHTHFAHTRENGGVMFFLCGGGGKPACPPIPDPPAPVTITGTVVQADIVGPSTQGIGPAPATVEDFERVKLAIRSGRAYGNVHSSMSPGGEIRGQLN